MFQQVREQFRRRIGICWSTFCQTIGMWWYSFAQQIDQICQQIPGQCSIIFLTVLLLLDCSGFVLDMISITKPYLNEASLIVSALVLGLLLHQLKIKKGATTNEEVSQIFVSSGLIAYGFAQIYYDFQMPALPPSAMPLVGSIVLYILHFVRRSPTHIRCQGELYSLAHLRRNTALDPTDGVTRIDIFVCGCEPPPRPGPPPPPPLPPGSLSALRRRPARNESQEAEVRISISEAVGSSEIQQIS